MSARLLTARSVLPVLLVPGLAAMAVSLIETDFYTNMLTLCALWAVLALSWNLISGYAGLISFGHAAFWGIGAYVCVILQVQLGITPWIGLPVAILAGMAAGALIGVITLRLSGIYFALAMLSYPMAMIFLLEYLGYQEITVPLRREDPLAWMQFQDSSGYAYLALGLLAVAMLLSLVVERSRMGLWLRVIRQNEAAASALGINSFAWKLRALILSGGMGAAGGAIFSQVVLVITPASVFGIVVSAQAIIFTIFGGVGTLWGPVLGAAVLYPLSELLHHEFGAVVPGISGAIYGVIVIIIVLFAPEGMFWNIRRRLRGEEVSDAYSRAGQLIKSEAIDAAPVAVPAASATKGDVLLSVTGLRKSFGGVTAVDDVGFEVHRGEILGIIGPNGAGKTTVLNLINGFIPSDTGDVWFDGNDITGHAAHEIARAGIGRTFQVVRTFPEMSLFGNVAVGALAAPGTASDWAERTRRVADRIGLTGRTNTQAGTATAYELRLMELARAAATKPNLLMVDECFAGLSSTETERVVEALRALRDSGITIVIVEHTMQAMVRLVDRFIVLDHGALIAEGPPDAVTRDPKVLEAYLGPKWAERQAQNA